jgi:hypothetical protein
MSPQWIIGLSVFVMVVVTPTVIVVASIRAPQNDKLGAYGAIWSLIAGTLFFGALYMAVTTAAKL